MVPGYLSGECKGISYLSTKEGSGPKESVSGVRMEGWVVTEKKGALEKVWECHFLLVMQEVRGLQGKRTLGWHDPEGHSREVRKPGYGKYGMGV